MATYQPTFLVCVTLVLSVCNSLGSNLSDERKTEIIQSEIKDIAEELVDELFKEVKTDALSIDNLDKKLDAIIGIRRDKIVKDREISENILNDGNFTAHLQKTGNDLVNWIERKLNHTQKHLDNKNKNYTKTFESAKSAKENSINSQLNSRPDDLLAMFEEELDVLRESVSNLTQYIAFNAFLSRNTDYEGIVCFDHVVINLGNGYNMSNGIFIAPKNGTYMFVSSFLTSDGYVNVELSKNGESIVRGYGAEEGYEGSGFVSSILSLVEGDKVGIKIIQDHRTGFLRGDKYSSFTGTLIR